MEERGIISNVPLLIDQKEKILDTNELVKADNAQYGNTFPSGSF